MSQVAAFMAKLKAPAKGSGARRVVRRTEDFRRRCGKTVLLLED